MSTDQLVTRRAVALQKYPDGNRFGVCIDEEKSISLFGDATCRPHSPIKEISSPQQPVHDSSNVDAHSSSTPSGSRQNSNKGTYNVRHAQHSWPTPSSSTESRAELSSICDSDGLRELYLHRMPDFDGFGFRVRYNKVYYLVHAIEPNSPAERSGLQVNDIILMINNQITDHMLYPTLIQIANQSSELTFIVQNHDEYLRVNSHSQSTLGQPISPIPAAAAIRPTGDHHNERGKHNCVISQMLNKLIHR